MQIILKTRRAVNFFGPLCCSGFAALALLWSPCVAGTPDPLLPAGEQAFVGSYRLDNVLLAPGKLVVLPAGKSMFEGMGDTPEQAAKKGLLEPRQVALLLRQDCTMEVLPNHTFAITNLPSTNLLQTASVTGTWSIKVYKVFATYGYRIELKCSEVNAPPLRAKFFNADKPDPAIVDVFYNDGTKDSVLFRFAKTAR